MRLVFNQLILLSYEANTHKFYLEYWDCFYNYCKELIVFTTTFFIYHGIFFIEEQEKYLTRENKEKITF